MIGKQRQLREIKLTPSFTLTLDQSRDSTGHHSHHYYSFPSELSSLLGGHERPRDHLV